MKYSAIRLFTLSLVLSTSIVTAKGNSSDQQDVKITAKEAEEHSGFDDNRIVEQCNLFKGLVTDNSPGVQRAEASAKLAGYIIERLRHKGELTNKQQDGLSLDNYKMHCGSEIERVTKLTKVEDQKISQQHTKALLDYALVAHRPEVDDATIMEIRKSLWYYHNNLDQHIQAENTARLAIDSLEKSGLDHNMQRHFKILISTSLMRQGRFAEAQKYLREALVLAEKNSSALDQAYVWFSLAFLYRDLGEYEIAERYFRQNLEIRESIEGKVDLSATPCRKPGKLLRSASVLTQLGIVLGKQGKHQEAQRHLNCAMDIFQNGRVYYELVAKLAQADNAFYLKDYPNAVALIDALLANERLLQPQKLDGLLIKLESLLQQKGQIQEAQSTASQIANLLGYQDFFDHKNLAKNINDYPVQQVKTFRLLIELIKLTGQEQWLTPFSEKGFQIIRQYQHQVTNPQAWNTARYDLIKSYLSVAYDTNKEFSSAETAEVFGLLEQFYTVDLDIEKNTFQANFDQASAPQELNMLYQAWLDAEHNLVNAVQATDQLRAKADLARDAYLSFRSEQQDRDESITPQLSLSDVQQHMPQSDILVRYFVNDTQSFVLLVSKDRAELRAIPDEMQIAQFSENLPKAIQQDAFHALNKSAFMAKLLPLEGFIQPYHDKLVLIPDNVLHRLPFSVVNLAHGVGRSEHLQIVRTHSASQYYANEPLATFEYASNLAIFANPLLSLEDKINASVAALNRQWLSEMGALPGSMLEANYIRQLFPNQKILFGTGEQANKAFLTQNNTRDSRILHIATHGYYQQNSPDIVGLVTSKKGRDGEIEPGFLSINELLSQPINSQLVVISGCDTMMGKYYKSSGMRSITRGFLAQGAQSVIGTLWPVQDKATAEFMRLFYQALKANQGDSAKALQYTKQQFATRGRYRQPKYWAGFALTANNHQAEKIELSNDTGLLTTSVPY